MKTKLSLLLAVFLITALTAICQNWELTGNSGTMPGRDFLGTTDNKALVLRTNNMERLRITTNGKTGIGIPNPQQKLDVNGNINLAEGSGVYIGNERVLYFPKSGPFPGVFIGQLSGNNDGGFLNTAVGYAALHAVRGEGNANVAVGSYALTTNTQGNGNTAVGFSALYKNTNGYDNTAYGSDALYFNTIGYLNTALGMLALTENITGSNNTATGFRALDNNTTGNNNTAGGCFALSSDSTGSNNTAVGNYADINMGNITNSTIIGNNALAMASNQVRIGNGDVTSIGGYADWTNISDGRVKRNITENVPGLPFINKLNPVTYNLDLNAADKIVQRPAIKDKDGKIIQPMKEDMAARTEKEQIVYTGFIAQDVEKAAKELNYNFSGVDAPKNDKDLYGLRYAEFVVPLVKAVQELSKQNDSLKQNTSALQTQINELRTTVQMLVNNSNNSNMLSGVINTGSLVKIYPVPVQSVLNIEFSGKTAIKASVNIYDIHGKLLRSGSAAGNTQLDVKQLPGGTYLIKITDENGNELYTGKVIKQ